MSTEIPRTSSLSEKHPLELPQRTTARSVSIVMVCTSAMILNIFSSTAPSVSLPTIQRHFGVQEDTLQWLISAFSLSAGCLLIFFGRLADLHGRKRAFLLGTAWLGVFSIACGFANDVVTLDVLRGIQGLGPAATIPASVGILAHAFPPSRARSIAFATFSAGAPVGGAIGQQIGGVLTQFAPATWRAPFFFAAGLAVLCAVGGYLSIDADTPTAETDTRVDWLGAMLVTTGLVLLTFVLGQGELARDGWKTPYIIALLIVSIISLAAFVWWQVHLERSDAGHRPPLMSPSLWTRANGKFAAMLFIAFLEWAGFISWTFWTQLYYQDFEHLSPVRTALRMLPMTITGMLCNLIVAIVIGRLDVVILVVTGTVLTSTAALLFALIDPTAPYWAFGFPAAITSVFGADFVFASGSLFVAKVALPHEQSLAGGLFQTVTQVGTAFGLSITTIVHNRVLRSEAGKLDLARDLRGAPPEVQLKAYKAAQWTCFAFAIFGAFLAAATLHGVGIVGHQHPTTKEGAPSDVEMHLDTSTPSTPAGELEKHPDAASPLAPARR